MNNVIRMEEMFATKTSNVQGNKDLITDQHTQLGVKEKQTLSRWTELGFPKPYAVINRKTNQLSTYQTYYMPFGKVKDNGKVRLQSKYYDRLVQQMQIVLNQIDSGHIQIVNTNSTIIPMLNEYVGYLEKMKARGTMTNSNYNAKATLIRRLSVVINSNQHLLKTKLSKWTASEVEMLWKEMFNYTDSRNTKRLWLNNLRDTFDMAILFKKIPEDQGNVVKQWMAFLPNKKELRVGSDTYVFELENTIKVWDFKKMKSFLESIKDERFRLAMEVGVYCGLRVAEIFGLEFEDLIFDGHDGKSYIKVSGQSCAIAREKKFKTKTPRGLNRMIAIPRRLAIKLKEYRDSELSNPYAPSHTIMFPNCHKGKWDWHNSSSSRTALENWMVGEFETPNKIRYHFFRHWIATQWLRHNIYEIYNVSYMLGHKNMSVTARTYAHVYQLKQSEQCDRHAFLNGDLF